MTELFLCPDCELPVATPDSLCEACTKRRDERFAQMTADHREYEERRARMRMTPNERFSEAPAYMAKVAERSKR